MTPKQRELLDYVETYWADHRCSPSYEEMRAALGHASKSGAYRIVHSLLEQGYLVELVPGSDRARNIMPARPELKHFTEAELRAELDRRARRQRRAA